MPKITLMLNNYIYLLVFEHIEQRSNVCNLHGKLVAFLQRNPGIASHANASGSACDDDCSRSKCRTLRQEADQFCDSEN